MVLLAVAALGASALSSGCERVEAGGAGSNASVEVDGSSTVAPITEAVATDFRAVEPDVAVSVKVSGTGGGFKRFCVGETQISNASRPISLSEVEMAEANGVAFIELPVALDGITFAVHKDNDWVDHLTMDEIARIFRAGSDVTTWSDVREGWPDREIAFYAPFAASGTWDFFNEVVAPDKAPMRDGMARSGDPHTLARGIAGDPDALGFFGFAYYAASSDSLRSVPIDAGDGPVRPSYDTIADAAYRPFSRPLYIYVNRDAADWDGVQAFVEFYLDNASTLAEEVGYVGMRPRHYELSRRLFTDRATGTSWLREDGEHIHASLDEVYGLNASAEAQ